MPPAQRWACNGKWWPWLALVRTWDQGEAALLDKLSLELEVTQANLNSSPDKGFAT